MDLDYELFAPDVLETDATLKGFNKNASTGKTYVGDKPSSKREPTVYMRWVDDVNARVDSGELASYDWIIIDSFTFLSKSIMDRQLFVNGRYGAIEDLGDFRIVGSKLSDIMGSIVTLPVNILATGHLNTFQDDLTKKIETQINLPGKSRVMMPLMFTDIWQAEASGGKYYVRTKPEARGFQEIRCSLRNLKELEDVTLPRFDDSVAGVTGIGALVNRAR
jgi:hypothetical protein